MELFHRSFCVLDYLNYISLTAFPISSDEVKYDLSPSQVTRLGWHVSQFMFELGHSQTGETILMALNSRLMKVRRVIVLEAFCSEIQLSEPTIIGARS